MCSCTCIILSANWLDHVQMFRQSRRYSRCSSVHRPQLRRRRGAVRTRSRKVAGRTQTFRWCCNRRGSAHLVGEDKTAEHPSRSTSSIGFCWRASCGGHWQVCLFGQLCWLHWLLQHWYSSTIRTCIFSDGPVRVCRFQFSCRFAFFINFSSFKSDTENNANFDTVSSKRGNFDAVQ